MLTIGLAKKIMVDTLGKHANSVFDIAKSMPPSLSESWSGTIAFSLQIYFDFSAYSDMAIGLGLCSGLYCL